MNKFLTVLTVCFGLIFVALLCAVASDEGVNLHPAELYQSDKMPPFMPPASKQCRHIDLDKLIDTEPRVTELEKQLGADRDAFCAQLEVLEHKSDNLAKGEGKMCTRIAELERKVAGMQRVINTLMAKTGTSIKSTTHKGGK